MNKKLWVTFLLGLHFCTIHCSDTKSGFSGLRVDARHPSRKIIPLPRQRIVSPALFDFLEPVRDQEAFQSVSVSNFYGDSRQKNVDRLEQRVASLERAVAVLDKEQKAFGVEQYSFNNRLQSLSYNMAQIRAMLLARQTAATEAEERFKVLEVELYDKIVDLQMKFAKTVQSNVSLVASVTRVPVGALSGALKSAGLLKKGVSRGSGKR